MRISLELEPSAIYRLCKASTALVSFSCIHEIIHFYSERGASLLKRKSPLPCNAHFYNANGVSSRGVPDQDFQNPTGAGFSKNRRSGAALVSSLIGELVPVFKERRTS